MARLPTPGGDDNDWGTVLNDFLLQAHDTNGNLKAGSVDSAIAAGSVARAKLDNSTLSSLARADMAAVTLVYDENAGAYPARPGGLPAGYATYRGPVAPASAIAPDVWEDTSGIWP